MANASSVISVAIVGDSRKLQKAARDGEKSAKGFSSSMKRTAVGIGAAFAGLFAVNKVFDVLGDATNEADRLGDATENLNRIIGAANTGKLTEMADEFTKLGLSTQDVLELSVGFARIARAAGLSKGKITAFSDDVAATAQALSLTDEKGRDASFWVERIGLAAGKPATLRSMKALGINIKESAVQSEALAETGKKSVKSLTDQELAAARLTLILGELKPALKGVTEGAGDVEQKRAELGAKIETLLGKLGVAVAPGLITLLTLMTEIVDKVPGWVSDFSLGFETVKVALGILGDEFRNSEIGKFLLAAKENVPSWVSDFLLGFDTVKIALGILGDEMNIFFNDIAVALGKMQIDFQNAVAGAQTAIETLFSPLARIADIVNQIFGTDHTLRYTVVEGGTRPSRNSPGSGPKRATDAEIARALRRERTRNGLQN